MKTDNRTKSAQAQTQEQTMTEAQAHMYAQEFDRLQAIPDDQNLAKQVSAGCFIKQANYCSECDTAFSVDKVDGYSECIVCGAIFNNEINCESDWRFDSSTDKAHCGVPVDVMLRESSLTTGITMSQNHAHKTVYNIMRKSLLWNSQPYSERALKSRLENINVRCSMFGMKQAFIELAQTIYYDMVQKLEASSHKSKRGNNNEGLQGAAVYYAFQQDNNSKTYKEVADIFGIGQEYVSEGIKLFNTLMKDNTNYHVKSNTYKEYADTFCKKLDLQESLINQVHSVADKAFSIGISNGSTPTAFVAGCILYVCAEMNIGYISKELVRDRCGVSIPTINNVCRKLFDNAVLLTD